MVGESLESARVCAGKQVSDEHMHELLYESSDISASTDHQTGHPRGD